MSHDDFIFGYQNGRLGCSVNTLLILRLFLIGQIREKRVVIRPGWLVTRFTPFDRSLYHRVSLSTCSLGASRYNHLLGDLCARVCPPSRRADRIDRLNRCAFLPLCPSRTCFICFH